jgi:SAM-dependent methyltransferase
MQGSIDTPENWGAASQGYAAEVAPRMMKPYMDEFVDRLDVSSDHDVLEVAAGSGVMTEVLAARARSVLATDFAPKMLEVLQARLQAQGIDNVRCEVMDGQDLTVDDGSFDCVGCSFGLMFFPDRVKGFSEMRRVLRPGGRAMVAGWTGPDQFEGFGLFMAAVKKAFPDFPPPPAPPPVFALADLDRFESEMQAGGFEGVEVGHVSRTIDFEFDSMWSAMTSGAPPVKAIFARIGDDGQEALRTALHEVVTDRFGDGPIRITNVATLGVGTAAS